jgi:hypothetical protein
VRAGLQDGVPREPSHEEDGVERIDARRHREETKAGARWPSAAGRPATRPARPATSLPRGAGTGAVSIPLPSPVMATAYA